MVLHFCHNLCLSCCLIMFSENLTSNQNIMQCIEKYKRSQFSIVSDKFNIGFNLSLNINYYQPIFTHNYYSVNTCILTTTYKLLALTLLFERNFHIDSTKWVVQLYGYRLNPNIVLNLPRTFEMLIPKRLRYNNSQSTADLRFYSII